MRTLMLTLCALVLLPRGAMARDFYVDPVSGSPSGDGSMAAPWRAVQEVFDAGLIETRNWESLPYADGAALVAVNPDAPVQPGDTLWLASGYQGSLSIRGAYNSAPITIAAMEGATPQFSRVQLQSVDGWILRGLSVSPSFATTYDPQTAIDVDSHGYSGPSAHVTIEGCHVFSVPDISGWGAADWVARAVNGIASDADDVTVRHNTLENVHFGISMAGARARVIDNSVRNFSGDGMRGLGDDSLFEHNYVANCYDVDDNHDDGFQSWSVGPAGVGTGEVRGMVLRGNVIINREDSDQPLSGSLQGIGCFDGYFTGWVVENNVIVVDHWHGITLLGARDSRVVNNTVLDPNDTRPGPPWIKIAPHKDGTEGTGNVVRNNLATAIANEGSGVTEDHNLVILDASSHFVSPVAPWDLHLVPTSPAIDQGAVELAPAFDRDGVARPVGDAVDLGAYEWTDRPPGVDSGLPDASDALDAGTVADAGAVGDAGTASDGSGGCGCSAPGGPHGSASAIALCSLALALRRRRSRVIHQCRKHWLV